MTAPLPADAHVLAVVVARIGDTLLATPVLRALREALPGGRLTCWAHPKRLEVLANLSWIDRLEGVAKGRARLRGHWAAIAGRPFDAAVVLGHDGPLIAAAGRLAARVAAFRRGAGPVPPAVTDPVQEPEGIHAVDHRLAILAPFGIVARDRRLAWQVAAAEGRWAGDWLATRLPEPEAGPILGLQTASFPTKAYRDWPAERFQELLAAFRAAHPRGIAVLFGDADSRPRAEAIAASAGGRALVLAGGATLRQTAAVMARCDAFAGVDTGPSHIAGALGLPMAVLYHPLHPGRNLMPLDHPAPLAVIEHPALDTAAAATAAMADIPAHAVWAALAPMLAAGGARRGEPRPGGATP